MPLRTKRRADWLMLIRQLVVLTVVQPADLLGKRLSDLELGLPAK